MTTAKTQNSDSANEHKGLTLLFADDEPSLQELMKLEIPRMGHRVVVCPDGLTAAAALEKDSFDCLLVDLDMPGLNGIDVIAKARELAGLPDNSPVALVAGKAKPLVPQVASDPAAALSYTLDNTRALVNGAAQVVTLIWWR